MKERQQVVCDPWLLDDVNKISGLSSRDYQATPYTFYSELVSLTQQRITTSDLHPVPNHC